ncbi:hypothetical protein [Streptomyces aureocirculatus]|uniref:hypothetical protein n=1 Tax=Streptomyces aureocirculatus TaxID=67275 RepID=UPI0004C50E14|nr:hypothetical protein [Streptomyces aureocirculatus]
MNVVELLADLQAQHDETTARADELRDQIEHLTAAGAGAGAETETEARLADLATTRKVIAELAPAAAASDASPAKASSPNPDEATTKKQT